MLWGHKGATVTVTCFKVKLWIILATLLLHQHHFKCRSHPDYPIPLNRLLMRTSALTYPTMWWMNCMTITSTGIVVWTWVTETLLLTKTNMIKFLLMRACQASSLTVLLASETLSSSVCPEITIPSKLLLLCLRGTSLLTMRRRMINHNFHRSKKKKNKWNQIRISFNLLRQLNNRPCNNFSARLRLVGVLNRWRTKPSKSRGW